MSYMTEGNRRSDEVRHRRFLLVENEARYEIDKKDEEFPTGVYLSYMTEGNRKSDEVYRRIFFVFKRRGQLPTPHSPQ